MPQAGSQQPAQLQQQRKGLAALSLSCVSASVAETATYPIDTIKTQLQLQRNTSNSGVKPAGALQLAHQIFQKNGLSGLYAGLSPAALRHVFYTGTRITLYEQLKTAYAAHQQRQASRIPAASGSSSSSGNGSNNGQPGEAGAAAPPKAVPVWAGLLFGLTAGGVGQLVAVPADLIKVQMQADVRAVMSGQLQQRQFNSISSVAAALTRQQGAAGLWRGGLPAVQRAALVNLGELSTYDSAKQTITQAGLLPPGLLTHLAASICSGFVSALISTPADVVKTRLMAQAVAGAGTGQAHHSEKAGHSTAGRTAAGSSGAVSGARSFSSNTAGRSFVGSSSRSRLHCQAAGSAMPQYRGMVDCAVQTVRQEGLLAMYKGFWPTWARLGPWQLVFWVTYEQSRNLAGIRAF